MSKQTRRQLSDDAARRDEDIEVLFHIYLDTEWPSWHMFRTGPMYRILRMAFFAGVNAA